VAAANRSSATTGKRRAMPSTAACARFTFSRANSASNASAVGNSASISTTKSRKSLSKSRSSTGASTATTSGPSPSTRVLSAPRSLRYRFIPLTAKARRTWATVPKQYVSTPYVSPRRYDGMVVRSTSSSASSTQSRRSGNRYAAASSERRSVRHFPTATTAASYSSSDAAASNARTRRTLPMSSRYSNGTRRTWGGTFP